MAVPVITWGSLGNMVTEQQAFADETAKYLEANEVHDLFDHLLRQLIVHQPQNPIKFLQEQMRSKPPLTLCLIGPPGVNRKDYAGLLAAEYKCRHINVGQLLRQNKEHAKTIERGDLVRDDIVINLVTAELAKVSKSGSGWVLDGFPRTKVQAQVLASKECGFCHDKVLLLQTSDAAVKERYAKKLKQSGYDEEDAEEIVERKLQQYHRHIHSIVEVFKNVIRPITLKRGGSEAGPSELKANKEILLQCVHMRPYSNAPLRPPRISVLGACASGRTTQCRAIAAQYGLVHVDVAQLLRSRQQATGMEVEEVPTEFLGDEEICDLVGNRLNEIDCVRKGWVLDGFPKNDRQAEFLRQSHLWPSRMVHLQVEEDEVLRRIASRKIDPVTGVAYYQSPNSVAIRQRLIQAPHDMPETVQERYALYKEGVEKACKAFSVVSFSVKGGGDVDAVDVTKSIMTRLNEPLPVELTQDPDEEAAR